MGKQRETLVIADDDIVLTSHTYVLDLLPYAFVKLSGELFWAAGNPENGARLARGIWIHKDGRYDHAMECSLSEAEKIVEFLEIYQRTVAGG